MFAVSTGTPITVTVAPAGTVGAVTLTVTAVDATAGVADTTAPTLVNRSPADNATNVNVGSNSRYTGVTWENHDGDTRTVHHRAILDDKGRIMVFAAHNTDNGDGCEREGEDPEDL